MPATTVPKCYLKAGKAKEHTAITCTWKEGKLSHCCKLLLLFVYYQAKFQEPMSAPFPILLFFVTRVQEVMATGCNLQARMPHKKKRKSGLFLEELLLVQLYWALQHHPLANCVCGWARSQSIVPVGPKAASVLLPSAIFSQWTAFKRGMLSHMARERFFSPPRLLV